MFYAGCSGLGLMCEMKGRAYHRENCFPGTFWGEVFGDGRGSVGLCCYLSDEWFGGET